MENLDPHQPVLGIIVPETSSGNVPEEIFTPVTSQGRALFEANRVSPPIPQRSILYFDELVFVYVVLQAQYQDEVQLTSYIPRLDIKIEAHAFSSARQEAHKDQSASPNRDILWSAVVDPSKECSVFASQNGLQHEDSWSYVVWKVAAHLTRPRIRLHVPAVSFKISGSLKLADTPASDDPYLTSGTAASPNLLEALDVGSNQQDFVPRIPQLRLSLSSQYQKPSSKDVMLKVHPSSIFRSLPALSARIRYSPDRSHAGNRSLIASLEIETATYLDTDLTVNVVEMRISDGVSNDLSAKGGLKLPLRCRPKDNAIFLFGLVPSESIFGAPSTSRTLNIIIKATVMVRQDNFPQIEMSWTTMVDFSANLSPNIYGGLAPPLIQRSERPTSQGKVSSSAQTSQETERNSDPTKPTTSTTDSDITITIRAPREIWVGEPFPLDLSILNRSSTPRQLLITTIPKRKPGDTAKRPLSKSSSSSLGGSRKDTVINEVIMDENLLHAIQRSTGLGNPELIPLSNDLKIGPLNPGNCYDTALNFLPLTHGVLHIEALRITDLVSNKSVDVRSLPDIIAELRPANDSVMEE